MFVVHRSGDNLKSAVFHSLWNTQEPRDWKQVLRAVPLKAKTLYFENAMMSWKLNAIVTEMEISARVSLSFQVWRIETFFYAVNDKIYSHEVNGNCELFRKPELVSKWNMQMKSICFCQWWYYVKCKDSVFLWGLWCAACEEKCLFSLLMLEFDLCLDLYKKLKLYLVLGNLWNTETLETFSSLVRP